MAKKTEYNDGYYNWVKGIGAYEKSNDPLKSDLFLYEQSKSPQVVAKSQIDRSSVYSAPVQADRERVVKKGFDSEGDQYDYLTAEQAGIKPNNYNKHMGSVAPVTEEMFNKYKKYGLPKEDSYVILKGNKHPTHNYTVEAENERGSEIKKFGDRYFSVPKEKEKQSVKKLKERAGLK